MSLCEHLYCPFFISILSKGCQVLLPAGKGLKPLHPSTWWKHSYAYLSEEVFMGFLRALNSKRLCRNKWILTQMDTISFSNDY